MTLAQDPQLFSGISPFDVDEGRFSFPFIDKKSIRRRKTMKKFSSKKALLLSVLSMVICVSMLIGSTFAWFTDSATANVNTIEAGNLEVDLQIKNAEGNWVSAEGATLDFVKAEGAPAGEKTLWEPGCTYSLPELRIVNKGNLALKYQLVITGATGDTMLLDVIKFTAKVTPEEGEAVTSDNAYGATVVSDGKLLAGKYATLNISAHMDETANNDYMKKSVSGIAIKVVATQLAHEYDSKGNDYDADAPFEIVKVSDEKELRTALYNAPTDGSGVKIVLQDNITLEMLYAAPNLPDSDVIQDYETGDTLNRYKKGVHPTAEKPNQWNTLVTDQTAEEMSAYGAYYHTGAGDERIARLVVKANQNVVIDLNGHTIAKEARATHGDWSNVCTNLIGNYGTLKITDSTGTGTVKGNGYNSCGGAVLHNYGGTMIVEKVNVDGNAAGMTAGTGQYVIVNDGGTTVINGANVYDTLSTVDASLVVNTAGTMTIKGNTTLNHPTTKTINAKGGTTIVESATIISDVYAVYAKGGTVEIVDAGVTVTGTGTMTEAGGTIEHK